MSSVIDPPAAPVASATGKAAPRHLRQAPPLKKSRLEFFSTSRFRTGVFESQVVEPHRKTAPTPTIIVSGMSVWPSRDPIGELGGANLYMHSQNQLVSRIDALGQESQNGNQLQDCLRSMVGKLHITYNSELNEGSIDARIEVDVDPIKCKCICEYPKFKQQARDSIFRLNLFWSNTEKGVYLINHGWQSDPRGSDWYPLRYGLQYSAEMADSPGQTAYFQPELGYFVEVKTSVYCTQGSAAGTEMKSITWGLEVLRVIVTEWPFFTLAKRVWPQSGTTDF